MYGRAMGSTAVLCGTARYLNSARSVVVANLTHRAGRCEQGGTNIVNEGRERAGRSPTNVQPTGG